MKYSDEDLPDFDNIPEVARLEPTSMPREPPPPLETKAEITETKKVSKIEPKRVFESDKYLEEVRKNLVNSMNKIVSNFDFIEDSLTSKEIFDKAKEHSLDFEYVQSTELLLTGYARFMLMRDKNLSLFREMLIQLREYNYAVRRARTETEE